MTRLHSQAILRQDPDLDLDLLVGLLSDIDAAEIATIEDDLDFFQFTHMMSDRLKALVTVASARPQAAAA